jgi:general secretion pathway protein A
VIVDEAQSLSLDVLEQLHLLSSLEIDGQKFLEVILIGEPWLIELLARAARHRLAQSTGYQLLPSRRTRRARTCATGHGRREP